MLRPTLKFLVICEDAFVRDTKLSILNVFDFIKAKSVPATHSSLKIVARVYGPAKSDYKGRISIWSKKSGLMVYQTNDFNFEIKKDSYIDIISGFLNLTFNSFSDYYVNVEIDGEPITNTEDCVLNIKQVFE